MYDEIKKEVYSIRGCVVRMKKDQVSVVWQYKGII